MDRSHFEALDRADPLARFRDEFDLPEGVIYLDGNSLGALPRRTVQRLRTVIDTEWGGGLIRSWNDAEWIRLPQRTGDKIARLIGASTGEVVACDSTSVNLFKALAMALRANGGRRAIVSDRGNFPTDLYIAQGLLDQVGGRELILVDSDEDAIDRVLAERGSDVAAVFLTHTHFTTAHVWDMARVTRAAHAAGALAVWDLSHSAGVMPIDLAGCDVDFAVGCGYKYLNGGPGAPAYLFVARRHHGLTQPISGWMGDARPFDFRGNYIPAQGASRMLSGTPPVIGMSALESAIDLMLEAPMEAMRAKSVALCDAFIALMDERCPSLELITSRKSPNRGSHVSCRGADSEAVMAALIERGVIGDVRPPDVLRFGFAPLYVRFVDVWDAVERIGGVLAQRA